MSEKYATSRGLKRLDVGTLSTFVSTRSSRDRLALHGDEDAYMALVLCNAQSELREIEFGLHAFHSKVGVRNRTVIPTFLCKSHPCLQ